MIYRLLFKFFILTFLFLSIANVVVISSGRMQVGTPVCQIYSEQSGRKCARLYCDATGVTLSSSDTCYDSNGNTTRPSEQYDLICEPTPPCRVTVPIYCNQGNRSAEYEKECNGETETVSSRYIYCPLSCTCSAPQGRKPCSRATWNTTSCSWNISRCNDIGGSGQECDPFCDITVLTGNNLSDEETSNSVDLCCLPSPVVIDILGNGYDLTDLANGVMFDFNGDGVSHRISWTAAASDDAWLVLDRNNDGLINSSREMFGNMTEQSASNEKNGFLALAEFDKAANGGNSDARIDQRDEIFDSLRLWQDANHDGVSEDGELFELPVLNVKAINLDYKTSRRTDEHGNQFKYRAKVTDTQGASAGRWAWDVFLVLDQPQN